MLLKPLLMNYPKCMKNKENHFYDSEGGNVLFLILVAVVLFVALSYAVTQSSRGSGGADKELQDIHAAQLLQYLVSIKQAVTRMQIINGCSDEDISFVHDGFHGNFWAHSPALDTKCQLFHLDGGGVSNIPPINNYAISPPSSLCYGSPETIGISLSHIYFNGIGDDDIQDLALHICAPPEELCRALYEEVGIPFYNGTDLYIDGITHRAFRGTYETSRSGLNSIGFDASSIGLDGFEMGCYINGSSIITLYMILIAR